MNVEAGKYYRTRGGERVGPAVRDAACTFADDGFVWRVGEYTYTDEGACGWEPDEDDIVAEWGEADEKAATPKFRPGDRVRCLETCMDAFTKGNVYTVRDTMDDDRILVHVDDRGSTTNGWLAEKFERVDTPTQDTTTPDNPCIKTVTRREVVPGELEFDRGACLRITEVAGGGVPHVIINRYAFTATALREAATAFNEIADALDEAGQ